MAKHELLDRIDSELAGVVLSEPVEIGGRKYGLKLLERNEESYARSLFPEDATVLQVFSDQSLPVLAVALKSVDEITVEELFAPGDDMSADDRKNIATPEGLKRWRYEQTLTWLNGKPGTFVEALWLGYLEMKRKAQKQLEDMRPLSNGTHSGESSHTSSPERGPLSVTPTSAA